MLLFNFKNYMFYYYVFLLLRTFRSGYSVSLCCSVYCSCVNVYCTVLLPPGVNPIAVNKCVIYHIKGKSFPLDLEWPRRFQKVKVPRFHDNGTRRW